MTRIKWILVGLIVLLNASVGVEATTLSVMDSGGIVMEGTGLVVTQNRIGVGWAKPTASIDVRGSVFLKKTLTFDLVDRAGYTVDWSKGNCQRMVITQDGASGISMGVAPSASAHLILSIDYNTDTPGKTTFSVSDPTKEQFVWSCDVSENTPISHNIDVVHFFYEKGPVVSTYNGFATFWYRIPE